MDDRYRTLFSARTEGHSRSLQGVGKASLANYSANNQGGSIFNVQNDPDLAMKFFEGDASVAKQPFQEVRARAEVPKLREVAQTDRIMNRKIPSSLPSAHGPYTDLRVRTKSNYAMDLHEQHRKRQEIESDRESDFKMLRHRYENDPFGRQGAGAPLRDEYGRIITTIKKQPFQNYYGYQLSNSADLSQNRGEISYENVDYNKIPTKPYNPYINRSHSTVPDFAIKAQLSRDQLKSVRPLFTYYSQNSSPILAHAANVIAQSASLPGSNSTSPQQYQQQHELQVQPTQTMNMPYQGQPSISIMQSPTQDISSPQLHLNVNSQPTMQSPSPYININGSQIPHTLSLNNLPSMQNVYALPNPSIFQRNSSNPGIEPTPRLTNRSPSPVQDLNLSILPHADTINEGLEKARKIKTELELQKELLVQMEERKRREDEERRQKKLDDMMEEERVRREQAELDQLYSTKHMNLEPRNLNLSGVQTKKSRWASPDKTQVEFSISTDVLKLSPGTKRSTKRPRTPIEEVEHRLRMEDLDRQRVQVEQQVIHDLPQEVSKQISKTITDELKTMRTGFIMEQQNLSDQIMNLRQHAVTSTKERISSQKEIDELKFKLKEQQLREEIRQGELYRALIQNNDKPMIIQTHTVIDAKPEEDIYPRNSLVAKRGYYKNLREKRDDDVRREVNSNSQLLSISKRGKILDPDHDTPDYGYSSAVEGLNYLKYFDHTAMDNTGIKLSDKLGRYDLPEDRDTMQNLTNYTVGEDEWASGIGRLLKKNNDRLILLDEMQGADVDKLDRMLKGRPEFKDSAKSSSNDWTSDEAAQEFRGRLGDDYSSVLLEQLNNPRDYS